MFFSNIAIILERTCPEVQTTYIFLEYTIICLTYQPLGSDVML